MCKKRTVYTMSELNLCLTSAFNGLNKDFFDGELEKAVITIKEGYKKHAYGWIETRKNWKQGSAERYEINISCDYLNRTPFEIVGTLLHEMCHLYALQNEIKDTSNSNIYHNERFKRIAEEHHLICTHVDKAGWTMTRLDEYGMIWVDKNATFSGIKIYKAKPIEKESSDKPKQSARKYICPMCGLIVRATKDVNILCMDCDVQMEKEN